MTAKGWSSTTTAAMTYAAQERLLQRRSTMGLSLVEVLVALAILGLVLASMGVALARAVDGARFKATTRDIATALRTARHIAVAGQTGAEFVLDVDAQAYALNGESMRRLPAPHRTTLTLVTAESERKDASRGSIRFFADGSSTGGTVTVSLGDRQRIVAVDWVTGRVQIEASDAF